MSLSKKLKASRQKNWSTFQLKGVLMFLAKLGLSDEIRAQVDISARKAIQARYEKELA